VIWEGKAVGVNRRLGVASGRMYKSTPYALFVNDLSWAIRAKGGGHVFESGVTVSYTQTVSPKRDVDSLCKPVLDAIQASGLIKDDLQVKQLVVETKLKPRGSPDRLDIEISVYT